MSTSRRATAFSTASSPGRSSRPFAPDYARILKNAHHGPFVALSDGPQLTALIAGRLFVRADTQVNRYALALRFRCHGLIHPSFAWLGGRTELADAPVSARGQAQEASAEWPSGMRQPPRNPSRHTDPDG
jgi:hypothetical protein